MNKQTYRSTSKRGISLSFLFIFLFFLNQGWAQETSYNPIQDEIYREGEVAIIKVTMAPEDKTFILADENRNSNEYKRGTISFKNSVMDTLVNDIGIRIRGNTSREHVKKSFKINFKAFLGEKFFGYKKFNLKAENNDASMIRELMALRIFRGSNVPAARCHHAELYINDEYMGLYLNVEQIDDEFVDTRFGTEEGNLYKCFWSARLENNGVINDNSIYELKTNKEINDRSKLAQFVKVLNTTPTDNFSTELEKVFNVPSMIRCMAVEALLGHWDGYSYNQNNYYLYENPENGLIEFIPYDFDNTFGLDFLQVDWAKRDLMKWPFPGLSNRPLSNRILSIDAYFKQYLVEINKLLNGLFAEDTLFAQFDAFKPLLTDAIKRDVYYPIKYGFSHQAFLDSHITKVADHAPYGLRPYVTTRTQFAREQVPSIVTSIPISSFPSIVVFPNPSDGRCLNLKSESNTDKSLVRVLSVHGQELPFQMINGASGQLKLSFDHQLASGIYFVLVDEVMVRFGVR